MKILTAKALGIGGGLATVTGGGITVACLSYGSSKTNPDTKKETKNSQPNNQPANDSDVANRDLPPAQAPKAITELLTSAGYEIPTKEADKSKWASQWATFKKQYQNTQLPTSWTIDGWDNIKNQNDAPEKYREKCIANGQQKIAEAKGEIFEEVKKYCATLITPRG